MLSSPIKSLPLYTALHDFYTSHAFNKAGFMFLIILLLAGCSSTADSVFGSRNMPEPIGIGRDLDELKKSPCACIEIQQDYSDWV